MELGRIRCVPIDEVVFFLSLSMADAVAYKATNDTAKDQACDEGQHGLVQLKADFGLDRMDIVLNVDAVMRSATEANARAKVNAIAG